MRGRGRYRHHAAAITIHRRWPSKGLLFLDSLLSLNEPVLDYSNTGDVLADLRRHIYAAIDLLANPPWGPALPGYGR
ncbi:hypothetical protein [Nonomuraea sp. NPDC049028]|uniref:hypothetical protein n=1 Tax=Nonomuraea sp. NPDC049028 TaxID=3364348 RepID=UPI0037241662